MAMRKIIRIDEEKCDGCGKCISACAEGALQLIDGKARLVKEQFCDGFGDCMGDCPTGALRIEECEADSYDPSATREYLKKEHGSEAVERFDETTRRHAALEQPPAGHGHQGRSCPGSAMRMNLKNAAKPSVTSGSKGPAQAIPSELNQWPVQMHLVQPGAPFFNNKELVVLSTCGPVSSADIHWRYLRGRSVVVACPKLDRTEGYVEKLAGILQETSIPKVIVVRMEVPCCGGLTQMVQLAVAQSGRTDLEVEEVIIAVNGDIM